MVYVEWLRVRRALIIVAWIAGIIFAISAITRVAMIPYMNSHDIVDRVKLDAGTQRHEETLADGTQRITLDDPDGTHIVIDDHGYAGKTVTIREPQSHARSANHQHVMMGSVSVNETTEGDSRITIIRTNDDIPIGLLFAFGAFYALIVATILGAPFGRENDGHLEYAFMRPISRGMLGLQMMAADIAGIAVAMVGGTVLTFAATLVWELPHLVFGGWLGILNLLIVCVAWYAFLTACTASMRRGHGLVVGLAIPAFLVVLGLGGIGTSTTIGQVIHTIFHTLTYIFPMFYFNPELHIEDQIVVDSTRTAMDTGIALGLGVVYAAIALVQWRRVQA